MPKIAILNGSRRSGKNHAHRFPLKMNEKDKYIKTFILDGLTYKQLKQKLSYVKNTMLEKGFLYESHKFHDSSLPGKYKVIAIGILKEDNNNAKEETTL